MQLWILDTQSQQVWTLESKPMLLSIMETQNYQLRNLEMLEIQFYERCLIRSHRDASTAKEEKTLILWTR